MRSALSLLCALAACSISASAQESSPATVPARMIVTLGHYYGSTPPPLTASDIIVTQRYEPLRVASLAPLTGGLDLYFLVDNCANCEPGPKFEELRRFILSQAAAVKTGVAYIDGGRLRIAQEPTADRELAVKALDVPSGSKPASPFSALKALIDGWKPDATRRAVLMISNGVNPTKDEILDASVEDAIAAAQRDRILVYIIYNPSADYASADFSQIYTGQVHLAHIANETGGEAYFLSAGPLPSLAPFLTDISNHLANQYLLEFGAIPAAESTLQEVTVTSKSRETELMVPSRVWVAGRGGSER